MGERKHCGEEQAKSQAPSFGRESLAKLRAIRDSRLCARCKVLLTMIVLRENQKTGLTIAGLKRLAQDSGLRQRTVQHLLPALHRAGVVRQIKRRNKTALRSVDVSILPTQQECTHSSPQTAPVCESRAKPWIRHVPAALEPPPSAEPDSPAGGELTPQRTPKILTPQTQTAPDGARSPSPALRERVGLAVSETTAGKNSVEGNDGKGTDPVFKRKLMMITREQDQEIAQFIPSRVERDAQYDYFYTLLAGPVTDPVKAIRRWMKTAPRFFPA